MAESNIESDGDKRKQFGNRLLTDSKNVFEHNAWDNVVWDEEQEKQARAKTEEQLANPATKEDIEKFENDANEYWNKFYGIHENKFFKDRHWLFTEFAELAPESYLSADKLSELSLLSSNKEICRKIVDVRKKDCDTNSSHSVSDNDGNHDSSQTNLSESDNSKMNNQCGSCSGNVESGRDDIVTENGAETFPGENAKYRMLEVGCGVGNTVFPILQANNDPDLMVYCCDYSSTAIDLVKENKDYDKRRCHAFVCDISDPSAPVPFPEGSLDIIIMIFILSANNPDKFQAIINRLASFLRLGGTILFRDYGRYDLAQLRFKKGRCLADNFYARGDGTRVYFFTQDEMREMMTKAGLVEKQNLVDRRLQVNRGKQLKMYRVWIQCKYTKPEKTDSNVENR
ncbi:tRNA N(3)-methylcytidine methyltransferase METTL2-like [Ruditapes philippinarum]|uniref:tRNA N(3)-methylcytidine methyltransferase METTL2-like n=1 Tax=Ruditapes philippinarum TaxID=129788 RepID=UPI00295B52F7|nr:tRNA N(3)-methylcytidine methyltransferase METTL2-like [Ruditapes philippinarum]XP_060569125.1 tRNA N(3)-methylcytidine methyltransferase METTL2-like [Ruditapes philippinarum]XP_060569126.1 tRNA N(3)-methylcytidine methyltransferase METTL2-like [Ruditapes philippinarum]